MHWKPLPPEVAGAARDLAEQLRLLLDGAGVSLRRLAADDEVPYSLTTLHRFFAGRALPPRELIEVIARKCDADLDELLDTYDRARQESHTPKATVAAKPHHPLTRLARVLLRHGR